MKLKKNIGAFLSKLVHDNRFLAGLSLFLALFVWFYILYVVNPVNEKVLDKVEVDLAYEGSLPDRNGYMYLLTDPNLTVSVTVSGSRAELLTLSNEEIDVKLNMDEVSSIGAKTVSVSATPKNGKLKVVDIYPRSFTIEFAEEATKEIPVELISSGALPSGYEINTQSVTPGTISVTGPAKTVETIAKAYVTVPLTNVKQDISAAYDVSLVNEAGESVDRRYLTLSDASVQAAVDVCYRKTLQTVVLFDNPHGGNKENSFITVTLDTPYIKATGEEKQLSSMENIVIGSIDTSTITKNTELDITVPKLEGATFDVQQVKATITFDRSVTTKTISFRTTNVGFSDTPDGKNPTISGSYINVKIRGKYEDLKKLNADTLKCTVDLSENNADGTFPVLITPTAGVSGVGFDVVGAHNVKVNMQ
ncbi:MAG: hypothetical protein IIY12_04985 [Clostridia bacterium]|nr:hypothetical protein [Clostridia bacterium]